MQKLFHSTLGLILSAIIAISAGIYALSGSGTALDGQLRISDAYMRVNGATSKNGAAFFMIENGTDRDVTLVGVKAGVARMLELHTHTMDNDGVMRMGPIEGGITVSSGQTALLERGHDHVMIMGLTQSLKDGEKVMLTLMFGDGSGQTIETIVDSKRK